MRIRKALVVGLMAAGLGFAGMTGCTKPEVAIPVAEMPAGQTFSGLWYTNYGDMKLTQNPDGTVRGTFSYKNGGEIEGTVTGGVMKFRWLQPGDFQVGRRDASGHAYLVLVNGPDGPECKGEWGFADNYTGGGKWEGRKAMEIYQ